MNETMYRRGYDGYFPGPIELFLTGALALSVAGMMKEGRDLQAVEQAWVKCYNALQAYQVYNFGEIPTYSQACDNVVGPWDSLQEKLDAADDATVILSGDEPMFFNNS